VRLISVYIVGLVFPCSSSPHEDGIPMSNYEVDNCREFYFVFDTLLGAFIG